MGCSRCGYAGGPGRAVYDVTFPCPACGRGGAVSRTTSNPRRNASSRSRPVCGACAQTWRWSKTHKTGYFTPCWKHEREAEDAAQRRASAKSIALARRDAQRKARQAAADLRRRALERGIDDVDDVPEEARSNPPPCGKEQLAALGWDELDGAHHFINEESGRSRVNLFRAIQGAAGQGRLDEIKAIFGDEYEIDDAIDFYVEFQPDDILGEYLRVWVRFGHPVEPS